MGMTTEMKIRVYSSGEMFRHGTRLDSALQMLNTFNNVYTYCINKCVRKVEKSEIFLFNPEINVEYIKRGSLSSLLTVDFPAAYAMVSPWISSNSWDLFKKTIEFAKAYIGTFRRNRGVPTMNIQDSPNSTNIFLAVVGDGTINVGKDVVDSFNYNKSNLSSLAGNIGASMADIFDVKHVDSKNTLKVIDKIRIDNSNSNDLIIEEKEVLDDDV